MRPRGAEISIEESKCGTRGFPISSREAFMTRGASEKRGQAERRFQQAPDERRKRGGVGQVLFFTGRYRALTYLGCALSAIAQLLGFVPYIYIWSVARDLIAVAPNWSEAINIESYGWSALAFAAGSIIVYLVGLLCTHLAAFRAASSIRKQTFEHLTRVSLGYFDTHASGALRRVIDGCASATETLLAHSLPDVAGSSAMFAGMLALFFVFDWRLGLACLLAGLVSIALIMSMVSGQGMQYMKSYQEHLVNMGKAGTEYVRSIPVLKVFQQTVYSFRAFHKSIVDFSKIARDYAGDYCRARQVAQLTFLNGMVIFLVPAAILLAPGEGDFTAFLTNFAFYAIFSAVLPTVINRLMFVAEAVQTASTAVSQVNELLEAPVMPIAPSPRKPRDNSIEFRDVSFAYEGSDAPALDGLSISVPAGTTLALVGPSGGGKTTAASLIPRFWDVDAGAVLVGGVDVREIDPHELMGQVAFVFQNSKLFHASLYDNVAAARPQATRAEVIAALQDAQCASIVEKLEHGVDTLIGPGGTYLSGGEVQRVALARALLKDAPIVVLDEATAFADPENEKLIQLAFSKLAQGRTVVLVAHRLSTVVGADQIAVLERGRVVERGVHDELVAQKGLYARMWANYQHGLSWKIENMGATAAESEA